MPSCQAHSIDTKLRGIQCPSASFHNPARASGKQQQIIPGINQMILPRLPGFRKIFTMM
jgi:hypothetical protein